MVSFRYAPIDRWPGQRTPDSRRQSHYVFKVRWEKLLADLEDELRRARAVGEVTIQLDVAAMEVRKDGLLAARARPWSPAVILSFTRRVPKPLADPGPRTETLVFANDTYDHWHANLRAISLTLKALRDLARWGAAQQEQQYAGFRALPPPEAALNGGFGSRGQAAAYLTSLGVTGYSVDEVEQDRHKRALLCRELVRTFHPDTGRDPTGETFKRIGQARAYLDDEANR